MHGKPLLQLIFGGCLLLLLAQAVQAQVPKNVFQSLLVYENVDFDIIFYSEGDTQNNGIGLRVTNQNPYAVEYAFKMVFRTPDSTYIAPEYVGQIGPREIQTGSDLGLWWIPFKDGQQIYQVGMRGYRVVRLREGKK